MDELALRVGDTERWAVDARLQQAVGDGLITLAEYEERAGEVWAARTRADLEAVSRDLPAAPAPVPVPVAAPATPPRTRRTLAVMGGDELRGPVAPGQGLEAYAVMGGALVDLRREDLPAEVHVRAVAVMGGVEVLVPRGVEVHLSGLSVMAGRELKVDPPRPGAPVVHVDAYALMGGVVVEHGKNSERVDAPVPREGVAVAAGGSVAVPHRGHRRGRGLSRAAGLALVAGALVGVGSAVDDVSVFGSQVVRAGDAGRDVGVLFGSMTVVVPDGAPVDSGGLVVFGSTDCDTACSGNGPRVRSYGAFGSVEVVTQSEYDAQRFGGDGQDAREAAERARDAAEDALENARDAARDARGG